MNFVDRVNVQVGRMISPGNERANRLRQFRVAAMLSSIVLVSAIDMTDSTIDACVYSLDGRGQDIVDVAKSIHFDHDGIKKAISGECSPHIGSLK